MAMAARHGKRPVEVGAPPRKMGRVEQGIPAQPKDLEVGTAVLYWDGIRGTVRDAYGPLNEFWIIDEATNELVRDEMGSILAFKAEDLRLLAPAPAPQPLGQDEAPEQTGPNAGVLVIGNELQMLRILEHFGSPDQMKRHTPQQLLAIPCNMCDSAQLLRTAAEGVDDDVRNLAKRLRPDIHVALRAHHLKQAVEQLGKPLLGLEGFYALAAVMVPFSREEIEESTGYERKVRRDICNQIDVCVTASGQHEAGERPPETARRVLGATCGICVADRIWDEAVQLAFRKKLNAEALPLKFMDANDSRIFVLTLPEDSVINVQDGILCFGEPPGMAGLAPAEKEPKAEGKTVGEWEAEQAAFKDQPTLPAGWIRVKSRSSDEVYYFNKRTQEATFDFPLPNGWTKQVSKSTGKTYYFNAKLQQSQYTVPTE